MILFILGIVFIINNHSWTIQEMIFSWKKSRSSCFNFRGKIPMFLKGKLLLAFVPFEIHSKIRFEQTGQKSRSFHDQTLKTLYLDLSVVLFLSKWSKICQMLAFILLPLLLCTTNGFRTQSAGVRGILLCGDKPLANTKVKLWDEDTGQFVAVFLHYALLQTVFASGLSYQLPDLQIKLSFPSRP